LSSFWAYAAAESSALDGKRVEFSGLLGDGGEEALVFCAVWSTKAQAAQSQDAFDGDRPLKGTGL